MAIVSKNIFNLESNPFYQNCYDLYKPIIDELNSENKTILDIGGGKAPLYPASDNYFVNDIDSNELSFLENHKTALFDVCGEIPKDYYEKFDLIIAKMVLEHLPSGKKYFENVKKMLKPDGLSITFSPTLFSLPFVINYILPNKLSNYLFYIVTNKKQSEIIDNKKKVTKFPAIYSYCCSMNWNTRRIKNLGFTDVKVIPIYGHNYFKFRFKTLHKINTMIANFCRKYNLTFFSSFALTIVKK